MGLINWFTDQISSYDEIVNSPVMKMHTEKDKRLTSFLGGLVSLIITLCMTFIIIWKAKEMN